MNIRLYISFILITIFVFSSCKKDEETNVVTGTVYNSVTSSTVNTGTVYLYGQKVNSSSWNASYSLLGQSAISAGSFKIEVPVESISSYRLDIVNNLFFKTEKFYTSDNFSDNKLNQTFYIDPSADVTIIVKNTSQYDENDFFKYTITNGYANYPDACSEKKEYDGMNISDTLHCKVIGEQEVVLSTISVINNVTHIGEKRIYCAPGEDTEILITY